MPRREDEDAGDVVVVPRHFLFGEEADDLRRLLGGVCWNGVEDEGIVEEGAAVEEDGFGFEEELGEEGEVLGVQLADRLVPVS